MTLAPASPAQPTPTPDAPPHPALRVLYRDTDHSYRTHLPCAACDGEGRVPGAREGTTKKCPKCKEEGVVFRRVPSVSTILAELNKPALVPWAAKMAAEAVRTRILDGGVPATADGMAWFAEELYGLAKNAHVELKDEAADIGTAVHDWITDAGADILDTPLPDAASLRPACEAYVAWWREAGFTVDSTERIVVEQGERFAGRFDLLVRDGRGKPWIIDIKTSNSVYVEHVLQCSAYATALRTEIGESIAGTIVVWCHKEGRTVRTVTRTPREYRSDYRVFKALLGIYEHRKTLGGELRRLAKESDAEATSIRDLAELFAS